MNRRRFALALLVSAVLAPSALSAQQPLRRWERRGFDFSPNGVWRREARRVREARQAALARGDHFALNAPLRGGAALMAAPGAPQRSTMAVTGTLYAPLFLMAFKNTATGALLPATDYDAAIFGATPPLGRPFTVRTLYEQMSNGLLSVQGQAFGWVTADSNDAAYELNCNALCWDGASGRGIPGLLVQAVVKSDATVDFGQYDSDGPDGTPNSGDDDGRVDMLILVHPEVGAECQKGVPAASSNIWSHRFAYSGWTGGGTIPTGDPRRDQNGNPTGQFIAVDDYIVQPGVGGATACDGSGIMPPGTIAHELGHGLNLPDLYDTDPDDGDDSEGIGEWGLMGSGNYSRPLSPAHMEGWSRFQLGWVTVRDVTVSGTYSLGAYTVADTVFRLVPSGANPRGEYFLIENRQAQDGDTALIADGKGPGLLVYHVDSAKVAQGSFSNTVNTGAIHGVWILQADGQNQLRSSTQGIRNRGDAGDPFPGTSNQATLSYTTNPNNRLNDAVTSPGFAMDSFEQLVPGGAMGFRLRFGTLTAVRASDPTARVRFRGSSVTLVQDNFASGDTATVEADTFQLRGDGRAEFRFQSWSDGGARVHQVTFPIPGDTLVAALAGSYRLDYTALGGGTIGASGSVATGSFVAATDSVVLTPAPDPGQAFVGWTGDTVASAATLTLRMRRAFAVQAQFQAALAASDTALRAPVLGAAYADTLRVAGGNGSSSFAMLSGSLPPGLALSFQGVISGTPTKDSTYTFTVRATSGVQRLDLTFTMVVTTPTLAATAVVDQLLIGGSALTAEERAYMDLQGNRNGTFDLGDVLAWFDDNPGLLNPAVMRRLVAGRQP
jgi:M6 family metalloprotease-like protein